MESSSKRVIYILPIIFIYISLTFVSLNFCYFWDTIQQISKEANWFFQTNFSALLTPRQHTGTEIVATGYHPPLMGIMTALLWKVFGYKLYVSHVFSLFWFFILLWNLQKVTDKFFDKKTSIWVLTIVLLEPTVLTQFIIASPDFILLTAFIVSVRAILERNNLLLAIGLFFTCAINMRGVFIGPILFISHLIYNFKLQKQGLTMLNYKKFIAPYLPTLIILITYYTYYFISRGWFFADTTTTAHYTVPNGILRIIKHSAEFILRSIENGRILIWSIGVGVAYLVVKKTIKLTPEMQFFSILFLLLTGIYILFIFITQMPFSGRYFMPQFTILTILTLAGLNLYLNQQHFIFAFILILFFELSGNLWIYPDKIAKSWDSTLAHIPFYELRKECFTYLDSNGINYNEVSAGFCLYGNQEYIDLKKPKIISTITNNTYFIYSNISNLEDNFALELRNNKKWLMIKKFKEGFVEIIIYKRIK